MRTIISVPFAILILVLGTMIIGGCSLHTSIKDGDIFFHLSTGDKNLD